MGERVRITDVAPRDGLQNEPGVIPTADKVRLVDLLSATGVDEIEVSSFVSPKWVPQLGDAGEVFIGLARDTKPRAPVYSALVPNEQGMVSALAVNERAGRRLVGKVGVFTATSETFSKKNTNTTIAESIERFRPVVALAHENRMAVRGYVSCAIRCPFEGDIPPERVAAVAEQLLLLGVDELDLGDTIGAGTPETVRAMLDAVAAGCPAAFARRTEGPPKLTLHLHDTFGRAADCVREALKFGVRSFDGSVAGLGGCPYASTPGRRAPGNISTEILVRTIQDAGFETGVDLERLREAAAFASKIVAAARASAPGATP